MATQSASRALPRALRRTRWPQPQISKRRIATAAAVERHEPEACIPESVPAIPPQVDRRQTVRDAKPFSDFLTDNFNRQHDYLRISLTERCNLRCLYCMPEEGIQLSPSRDILTTAEIYYLSALFVNQGVNKIRLTGGEPTVRKDIVPLMQQLGTLRRNGLKEIALTTNAISLHRKLDDMVEAGLTGVNISLDTLDPHQFVLLTRRQGFEAVMKSIKKVLEINKLGAGIKLKINCVAMRGLNHHQILPFVDMTRDEDIEVRFIEYMPFAGNKWSEKKMLPYAEMLDLIRTKYPGIERLKGAKNDTSKTWQVPGFKGRVGFITSMTHNFCGTCNRLRITSDGNLKVCLHGETEVSLRDLLRRDNNADPMDEAAFEAIRQIELDRRKQDSYRFDGEEGWISKERQLLEVIGAAVKRKKAKHAGIGENNNRSSARSTHTSRHHGAKRSTQSTPWSRIPTHLLLSSISSALQSRPYSTDRDNEESSATTGEPQEPNTTSSRLASTFGFQSLSGLFQEPPRGRYSRPRRPEIIEERPRPTPDDPKVEKPADSQASGSTGFFTTDGLSNRAQSTGNHDISPTAFQGIRHVDSPRPVKITKHDAEEYADTADHLVQRARRSRAIAASARGDARRAPARLRPVPLAGRTAASKRGQISSNANSTSRGSIRANVARTRPNPFAIKSSAVSFDQAPSSSNNTPVGTESAWGLSRDEEASADSILEPGAYATELLPDEQTSAQAKGQSSTMQRKPPKKATDKSRNQLAPTLSSEYGSGKLTHVKESGEAHMVDVGAKRSTKRVAIAMSSIYFSNDEPARLISENGNKKGDVLGVARIAGLMAAKRTSELIPLCHPIAISKAEVDVKLHAPNKTGGNGGKYGAVTATAQVECTGPTGVEMEALTAASTATLTVFDMCKAVDRDMNIQATKVVYKSGGRSGVHANIPWEYTVGRKFFTERGLEAPELMKKFNEHMSKNDTETERA